MIKMILIKLKRKSQPCMAYAAGLTPVGVVEGKLVANFISLRNKADIFMFEQ